MTRTEKNHFIKWARSLSNEQLEDEYYKSVLDSLGSEAEEMYERGWDMADVLEQKKHERDLCIQSDILGMICEERGIKLWEEEKE